MGAQDFISSLLNVDTRQRLGYGINGISEIKSHVWMSNVPWTKILSREMTPPFVPSKRYINHATALYNDPEFLKSIEGSGEVVVDGDYFADF